MKNRVAILLLPLALSAAGCTYGHHDDHEHMDPPVNSPPKDIASSTIDTGATLAAIDPGQGAGAFVEYQAGGTWRVFTACDSAVSGFACRWDIIVSPLSGALTDLTADNLEGSDTLGRYGQKSARFLATTDYDLDGFFVTADPGAKLRVDVFLDDQPAPRFIYWVGDGGLHAGSPTNPLDLTPSAP